MLAQSFPLLSQNHNRFISVFPILPLFTISSCDVSCGGVGKSLSYMHSHIDISIYIRSISLFSVNSTKPLSSSSIFFYFPSTTFSHGGIRWGPLFPVSTLRCHHCPCYCSRDSCFHCNYSGYFFSIFVYFFGLFDQFRFWFLVWWWIVG